MIKFAISYYRARPSILMGVIAERNAAGEMRPGVPLLWSECQATYQTKESVVFTGFHQSRSPHIYNNVEPFKDVFLI